MMVRRDPATTGDTTRTRAQRTAPPPSTAADLIVASGRENPIVAASRTNDVPKSSTAAPTEAASAVRNVASRSGDTGTTGSSSGAEVELHDSGIGQELTGRAVPHIPTLLEDVPPIGDLETSSCVLFYDEDRDPG